MSKRKKIREKRTVEKDGDTILVKSGDRVRVVIRKNDTSIVLNDIATHTSSIQAYSGNAEAETIIKRMLAIFS